MSICKSFKLALYCYLSGGIGGNIFNILLTYIFFSNKYNIALLYKIYVCFLTLFLLLKMKFWTKTSSQTCLPPVIKKVSHDKFKMEKSRSDWNSDFSFI